MDVANEDVDNGARCLGVYREDIIINVRVEDRSRPFPFNFYLIFVPNFVLWLLAPRGRKFLLPANTTYED